MRPSRSVMVFNILLMQPEQDAFCVSSEKNRSFSARVFRVQHQLPTGVAYWNQIYPIAIRVTRNVDIFTRHRLLLTACKRLSLCDVRKGQRLA